MPSKAYYEAHKAEMLADQKKRYDENIEDRRAKAREYWKKNKLTRSSVKKVHRDALRLACLKHYGGLVPHCVCCKIKNLEYLTIDHVGGGGADHRREIGLGNAIFKWLIDNGFPEGFRVLCFNCNFAISAHGVCPHASVDSDHGDASVSS